MSGPVALWGSSYSAILALRLAADAKPNVRAVLAFSPAAVGPMADCRSDEAVARLRVPLLALRPASEMEIESASAQMALFAGLGHEIYVSGPGVHGSSMLNPDRGGAATDAAWGAVLSFLRRHLSN